MNPATSTGLGYQGLPAPDLSTAVEPAPKILLLDTSSPDNTNGFEDGRAFYFYRNLHRDYQDSYNWNPRTVIAEAIFAKIAERLKYCVEVPEVRPFWSSDVVSSELAELDIPTTFLIRELPRSPLQRDFPQEELLEQELFFHDFRHQGLVMNWERAEELYKKLLEE